jgi:hypothetical protein
MAVAAAAAASVTHPRVARTQNGSWQKHASLEDTLIGGKVTLRGRELQLAKSWVYQVNGN